MRRLTPWITWLEEGEETHVKGTEIILNYIIKEKFSNLNSQRPTKLQKGFRFYMCRIKKGAPNDTQNLKKTLYTQNEEGILKVQGKKCQVTCKTSPIRMPSDFLMETVKDRRDWTDVSTSSETLHTEAQTIILNKTINYNQKRKKHISWLKYI